MTERHPRLAVFDNDVIGTSCHGRPTVRRFLVLILLLLSSGATGCKSWPFKKDRTPTDRDVITPPNTSVTPFWPEDSKALPPPPLTPPVDWNGPNQGLNIDAPKLVTPGQDVSIRLEVADPSSMTVRHAVPSNVQILRTEPPARLQGSDLVWDLPPANNGRRDVTVVYRTSTPGSISLKAEAIAANGARRDARATTQVGVGQLALQVDGPSTASLLDRVNYQVRISNSAASPVGNVVLRTELPTGLNHESGNQVLEVPIPILQANESKSLDLPLSVTAGGQYRLVVTAHGDGGVSTLQERTLTVQETKVSLTMAGPTQAILQKPGTWTATIRNDGTTPAKNLQVRMTMPNELRFQQVSPGGKSANNIAQWTIESLAPGESRPVELTALPIAAASRTTVMASLIGDGVAEQRADKGIEIIGVPLMKLTLTGSENRAEVGRRIVYTAEVRNAGSTPLEDIEIVLTTSAGLKPVFGFGPTMARIDGGKLNFGRVERLEAGKSITFQLEAETATAGDARVTVEARSKSLPTPILVDEATRVVGP